MKNVHEIFNEFKEINYKTAKKYFIERLNYYISSKYENDEDFSTDYVSFLFEMLQDENLELRKIKDKARKNIKNWLPALGTGWRKHE